MSLKIISNALLIEETEKEIRFERKSTLRIIKLFQEIYDRKIYLELGFSSFYDMATKQFGYCAGSAMRRINAMKLVREMPQFEEKIESGELSLSVAADVQTFLYQEAKTDRPYSLNAKIELVETCLGKTRREVEFEFVRRNPERDRRETVQAITQDRLRVSFSISKELSDKLDHLKDLLGHVDATMTTESLIERLAELGLDKYDPQRKATRANARKKKAFAAEAKGSHEDLTSAGEVKIAETPRTRYIAATEKHTVAYDGNGCEYRAGERRCGSKKFLQLDHVQPFKDGGASKAANLRWMCAAHNQWRASQSVH